ncbi:MAG: hypothetical protein Q4A28_05070 [Brachymonas sp.]|nr:hypothetical protein [Brachymonas sp.]
MFSSISDWLYERKIDKIYEEGYEDGLADAEEVFFDEVYDAGYEDGFSDMMD